VNDVLPEVEAKPAYVKAMFDRIAARYDLANDAMTLGHHRAWKGAIAKAVAPKPGERALDLATGTGDIARRLRRAVGEGGRVVGLDFSPEMLAAARRRGEDGVEWLEGDMLNLPFEDGSFDVVTVGFGLRNVNDLPRAIAEAYRVLAPGGRYASLDLAKPRIPVLKPFMDAYSFGIVPLIGKAVAGDDTAYKYLPASNESFPEQDALGKAFEAAGFTDVRVKDLLLGAAALVWGRKPG
jgi:demethylmenaquinone methyltransferase/2-methoxy-6-polyprenyl-1,4-benzoquinol methylase